MGEKTTQIVFGAFRADIEGAACPDEDGWSEWAYNHPEFVKREGHYGRTLLGARFGTSYESRRPWVGFTITTLEYRNTWEMTTDEDIPAVHAWNRFRELAAEVGAIFPAGRIIIAHDE